MKRQRKKRKRVFKPAPPKREQAAPGFPVAISIYKKWIDKEKNAPVDFGMVMCACMLTLGLQDRRGQFPFTLDEPDDESRTFYLRATGVESLGDFHMVQVVDHDSKEGQEMVAVAERVKDISLGSGQYSESEIDNAIAQLAIGEDGVKIPLVDCGAGEDGIGRILPPEDLDADNWNDLPALAIGTLQSVFDNLLGYLLSEAVLDGTPDFNLSLAGDRRWVVQGSELDLFIQRWDASRVQNV